jgi:hypothetical protein
MPTATLHLKKSLFFELKCGASSLHQLFLINQLILLHKWLALRKKEELGGPGALKCQITSLRSPNGTVASSFCITLVIRKKFSA